MEFKNSEEKSLRVLSISQKITNQLRKAIKVLRRFRGLWLRVFDFIVIVVAYIIAQILAIIFTMREHIRHTLSHGTWEPEKWSRPKYKNVFDGFREKA